MEKAAARLPHSNFAILPESYYNRVVYFVKDNFRIISGKPGSSQT
jgi:hypothetical protein